MTRPRQDQSLATKSGNYIPDREDIIWLSFDPQAGHEQAGRRLAVVVPITSHAKGYPFEVAIPAGTRVSGVILADHLKSLDWRARKAERIGGLASEALAEVLKKASLLISAG